MHNVKIAPSILSANFVKMGEEVLSLKECGADVIHCDVMDGVFVPNLTFGIKMVSDLRKITDMCLDCHLMIVNPIKYVNSFAKAGADIITVHYEACKDNLVETLEKIKDCGVKRGVAINPDTDPSVLREVIELCDLILVMSVFPGFGGQSFIPSALDSLKKVKSMIDASGKDIILEVDGGINLDNVSSVKSLGVNYVVAGNTVFSSANRAEIIEKLRNL